MNDKISNRKLTAIMFADIVSYSRLMGTNEGDTLKLLKDFEDISFSIVDKYDGIVVKKNGDQIFCEFNSAKNAVDASISIQTELNKYNDSRPKDFKLEVRIGIHIGDVTVKDDGDIFGDGVNVASRIQPLASPGGICISGAVSDAISSHPEYNIISKGEQELKNILKKHSVFEVQTGYETIDQNNIQGNKPSEFKIVSIIFFIILIGYSIFYFFNTIDCKDLDIAPEENIFLIGDIVSNSNYIEYVKKVYSMYKNQVLDNESLLIEEISDSLKNYLYDGLITKIEINNTIPNLEIINKYELNQIYSEKGQLTPEYINKMLMVEDGKYVQPIVQSGTDSVYSFKYIMKDVGANLGTNPIIYKISENIGENKYLFLSNFFSIKNEGFRHIWDVDIYDYSELEKILYSELFNNLNNVVQPNEETEIPMFINEVKGNNVIFKFSRRSKFLKEGTILTVQREYTSSPNVLNTRLDDLYYIQDLIDKNPNSDSYQYFYDISNGRNSFKEINDILSKDHLLVADQGTVQLWVNLGIKLKVVSVFDSTASAIIYKRDREFRPTASYSKVRNGDKVVFMTN